MKKQSNTPAHITIEPRNRHHEISDALSKDWFDNHPFKTAWFNSMSITFPLGEKFFIDSVRHFVDQIEDSKLQEEIKGFCGQEGFHRREHDLYNKTLCNLRGYDLNYLEGRLAKNIELSKEHYPPIQHLAFTAALEHITAIMAESALADNDPMMTEADPAMKALWDWHAAEEMEHKAVAFDVYRAAGGTEKMRKRALRQATFFLSFDIIVGITHMLRTDKKMWRLRLWVDGWKFLFYKGGILRRLWPAYKAYLQDDFHPWQRDTEKLLNDWKSSQVNFVDAT
jgi:predicted metal-dependent hydrolase